MNRTVSSLLCVVCALIGVLAISERAAAETRPYRARGTAQFISPTEFVGQGSATHLGTYREQGTVSFSPTSNPAVLHVDGSATYTAVNGDELHAVISGELNGMTGAITATLTYMGGTGRFADASGTSQLVGQLAPTGAVSVAVNGTIDY